MTREASFDVQDDQQTAPDSAARSSETIAENLPSGSAPSGSAGSTGDRAPGNSPPRATSPIGEEISARTGFARNRLWRDGEHRTEKSFSRAVEHPQARFYLTTADGKWLCRVAGSTTAPAATPPRADPHGEAPSAVQPGFTLASARENGARLDAAVLLGFDADECPHLAAPIAAESSAFEDRPAGATPDPSPAAVVSALKAIDLRSLAMQGVLDRDTEGQLGQAAHLIGWHSRNGFCARCGGRTVSEAAGYRRRCTVCDAIVFPRTDPVTIMLVHDGKGRCILGRQPQFPEHFWSCLAGFVEAGETVEDAVRRETLEEAGVHVGRVTYLASQPWPFPGSLMIGCIGLAQDFDIAFDGEELEACRWFERDEVKAMLDGCHRDGLSVPKRFAIAHHLVKAFADGDV